MVRIAIVEDEQEQADRLQSHIRRYGEEHQIGTQVTVCSNVITFLEQYKAEFDIVFMDIMMPMMNGMDAAHLLREKDDNVMLIFVTSMRQYALQGYDVAAADFIVKPVPYAEFTLKFTRALAKLPQTKAEDLLLRTEGGFVRLTADRIRYVEVRGHHCAYHTDTSTYQQYQTMKAVEDALPKDRFARCNNFLLVNLAFVEIIEDMTVWVAGEALPISHPRKKPFSDAFARFAGSKQYD